eukprot:CAMPEP_0114265566 /NCGR_PEP_ID=MMETSP0058-20121206/24010_1 /TAXON_ID=36894 /ORGANISM="Pyramimonas parkeae, CCMP726" /LENGTH=100 /DNA_ID=CAMNT_0001382719 /DNA_START=107 /DNA_END=407 /DNA_ORIENTATION=+
MAEPGKLCIGPSARAGECAALGSAAHWRLGRRWMAAPAGALGGLRALRWARAAEVVNRAGAPRAAREAASNLDGDVDPPEVDVRAAAPVLAVVVVVVVVV